jgi:hypothetical protein
MSYANAGGSRYSEYINQSQATPQAGAGRPPSRNLAPTPAQTAGGGPVKVQPLLCSGHTRPVVHLQFSNM